MSITIIKESERIEATYYEKNYWRKDDRSSGYGFACDKHGKINFRKLKAKPQACENYLYCEQHQDEFNIETRQYHHSYLQPAVGRCQCGVEIELGGFTNTCDCGRDYNWAGQELADRSQWGEETGESLSDILKIP